MGLARGIVHGSCVNSVIFQIFWIALIAVFLSNKLPQDTGKALMRMDMFILPSLANHRLGQFGCPLST